MQGSDIDYAQFSDMAPHYQVDDGTVTTALPRPADHDPENMPEPQDIMTVINTLYPN